MKTKILSYLFIIIGLSIIVGCEKEEVESTDTEKPIITISNINITDADNDGHPNDLTFSVTATDNTSVNTLNVTLDGNTLSANNNTYELKNLAVGNHTIAVKATDTAGNTATKSKSIIINDKPDTVKPTINNIDITITDLENDTNMNDITISFDTNDDTAVVSTKVTFDGNTIDQNSDKKYMISNAEIGNHEIVITATDAAGNQASEKKNIAIEQEQIAPTITVNTSIENLDENFYDYANDLIINIEASDANGIKEISATLDDISIELHENGTVTKHNVPTGTHKLYVTATDNNNNTNEYTQTIAVAEPPQFIAVNLPDVTYVRSFDDQEVTEDLSYTSVGNNDGAPVIVKIDGNDTEYVLTGFDQDGTPLYEKNRADFRQELENTSYADALTLNMAYTYENGGYGVKGFKVLRNMPTEDGQTGCTLENQHGEIVNLEGYDKGIQYVKDQLGVNSNAFLSAPNLAAGLGENTLRNCQITFVFCTEFAKKMQLEGANDKNTMFDRASEAFMRLYNMTDENLYKYAVKHYGQEWVDLLWE